jgi:hypothetical protein
MNLTNPHKPIIGGLYRGFFTTNTNVSAASENQGIETLK